MFDTITHVVDMNFVQRIGVEHVKVRPALRILKWLVVGQQGHEVLASGLITLKHIKIGPVDFWVAGNKWCFAVTGRESTTGGCQQHDGSGQMIQFHT